MLRSAPVALVLIALLLCACTAGAPAATPTTPTITTAPPTPTIAAATPSAVAVVTPSPVTAEPTVAPKTTDPYIDPDDKYTPRPTTGATAAASEEPGLEPVEVSASDDGSYLVGPNGMTLYTFDEDADNESNCNGGCADAWPPLGAEEGQGAEGGDGVDGEFTVFHRDDDSHQVAYNGEPLYYYSADQEPGDTLGDGVNGTWHLAVP